jgi:hypothetical protein
MKKASLILMGAAGLCAAGAAAAATALLSRGNECSVSMHPDDWRCLEGGNAHRRYLGPGQALHHLREAAGLARPTAEVYLRQSISPAFREMIMITTATSNNCPI